ncbi:glutathione S-transferase-like [Thrips palmi]|uniref:glutathione transferase n=1 Tax=Thrips palmi TaxID=161013 RepID=A0A6P8ZZA3_THRPL|nr:glutathione S-transferase-like [Thrips palmi]
MAPKYKLHYFNVTALGEPVRYLLAYGKADWEDIRYEAEDWEKVKAKMPFGQMPVLDVDGKFHAQSVALSRYLAKQYGLAGKDDLENLQIDIAVDLFGDFRTKIGGWYYDAFPESKAAKEGPLFKEQIPFYLNKFEEIVKANGGYLVNGKLTWADIYFVAPLNYFKALTGNDFLVGYPGLQALVKTVESQPDIAAYIAKRPVNPENK